MTLNTFLVTTAIVICFGSIIPAHQDSTEGEDAMKLADLVPDSYEDWIIDGEDGLYDTETIFEYMNGAGEVYRSFHYKELFVRRFKKPGEEGITIELFDMGLPADAYGIFVRNREGEDAGIGQGSEYRSGYMVFWKGRYFATVYTFIETEDSKEAVYALSRSIAEHITETGEIPAIVGLLDDQDLLKNTVRYFHLYTDLNQHYFVADENILNLSLDTDAVIATYLKDEKDVYLLIVKYPSAESAGVSFNNFISIYMPEAESTGYAQLEDGTWTAADSEGQYLVVALDSADQQSARSIVESVINRIKGEAR
jgi:hypothetical protein